MAASILIMHEAVDCSGLIARAPSVGQTQIPYYDDVVLNEVELKANVALML